MAILQLPSPISVTGSACEQASKLTNDMKQCIPDSPGQEIQRRCDRGGMCRQDNENENGRDESWVGLVQFQGSGSWLLSPVYTLCLELRPLDVPQV